MLLADFSEETLQAIREWHDIFKILKGKKKKTPQLRIFYPARLSFKIGGDIKNFSDKQKQEEFNNTKTSLKRNVEGLSIN